MNGPSRSQTSERSRAGPDLPKRALHLAPAVALGILLLDLVGGVPGGVLAALVMLLAPGWLVWRLLPDGVVPDAPLALPGVWIVFSFAVVSPVLAATVSFGLDAFATEWYLLGVLVVLGVFAGDREGPALAPWGRWDVAVVVAGVAALVYRVMTWHDSGDDVTYLGFMRPLAEGAGFPTSNPFLTGDVPLPPRWRLDGWTGLTGVIAHLGDADPAGVYFDILPPMLLVLGASALYGLARVLSDDRRLAELAAISALVVPLLTSDSIKSVFKFWYQSIAQNKYAALVVFLPTVVALLISATRPPRALRTVVAAVALWALMFVHPVVAVLAVTAFVAFRVVEALAARQLERSMVVWSLVAIVPFVLTAAAASSIGERHGTRIGDVERLSEIAQPTVHIGPIDIWEPRRLTIRNTEGASVAAVFVSGHAISDRRRVAFLGNGFPIAHWSLLGNPANLFVLLAVGVVIFRRRGDPAAWWILASTAAAVSVFVLPPFAAAVGRFITPWQLWRFAWLMPVPFAVAWLISLMRAPSRWRVPGAVAVAGLLVLTFALSSHRHHLRTGPPAGDRRLARQVAALEGEEGVLLANNEVADAAASANRDIEVVSFRGLTSMSNAFPSSRRDEAYERFSEARLVFARPTSDDERRRMFAKYGADLVVLNSEQVDRLDEEALGLELIGRIGGGSRLYRVTP